MSGLRASGEKAIQEDSRYGEEVYNEVDQEHGEDVVHDDVVHGCCRRSDVCGSRRLDETMLIVVVVMAVSRGDWEAGGVWDGEESD
jgi:hypothetical protein